MDIGGPINFSLWMRGMGENGGVTRRAAMFGVVAIAATMAGNAPVGAAYAVDTTGDGIPDAIEFVEEKAHSLAGTLAAVRGGEWAVKTGDDYVMILRKTL